MIKVLDIFNFIDSFAPFDTAMDFDNVGVLVGSMDAEVKKCLVALDVTEEVINEAKNNGVNLIISHHPVIFNAIKRLDLDMIPSKLIKNEISVLCAHTNLDVASIGVNTCLAERLSLQNLQPLSSYLSKFGVLPMGLVGELENACECNEFAEIVKTSLNCQGIRYTDINKRIKKVAICSGAGGDLIDDAIRQKVDAFVTGEIKHHEILTAVKNKVCVYDAGHFKTEDIVVLPLVKKLSKEFTEVEFIKSQKCTDRIKYMV